MSQDQQAIENTQDISQEDAQKISRKSIKRWVNTNTDKLFVKAIKNDVSFDFKFLDNSFLQGKIKWFNKYNLSITAPDGSEYIILKHAIKYMIPVK
jgi:sRNA-binding regulator protein Hfq